MDEKIKQDDRTTLVPGALVDGVIVSTRIDQMTCSVSLVGGPVIDDCVLCRHVASALLGFKIDFIPPPGTKCKVAIGSPHVIVVLLDSTPADPTGARDLYSVSGTDKKPVRKTKTFAGRGSTDRNAHTRPRDLLEGEYQITNILGVALSMLTTMAKLSAGDRASVEVFLLNDMVRIVSATYKHFSAVGQQHIYNDGRLNARMDASSYEHEALGLVNPKDVRAPVEENAVKLEDIDKVLQTGRWRYSHFLGFLGDFFHLFVTDPVATAASIGQGALRSGNAHIHVGSGGEVLVQSISEIALERVVRIPVPIDIMRSEDPDGVLKEEYESLDNTFLKLWKYDTTNPSQMVFQIREYARWLSTYHSLARFHQLKDKKGEWHIPKESECPVPDWAAQEKDKTDANAGAVRYKDTYACIRIMRDGSIVNLNGEGGAFCLAGKNVYISAPGHMFLESGGDMRFTSGQSMYFMTRRSMEFAAIAGGIRMKARTWFHGLCERGSVWLKSDALNPLAPDYVAPVDADNRMDGQQDPMPIVLEHAVMLEGTQGRVGVLGTGVVVAGTGIPADADDESADVVVQSGRASVRHMAGRDVELRASRRLLIWCGGDFALRAGRVLWSVASKIFDIKDQATFRGKTLHVSTVRSNMISALRSIFGRKVGGIPDPNDMSTAPLKTHYNHIFQLPDDLTNFELSPGTADELTHLTAYTAKNKHIKDPLKEEHPIWDFDLPAVYQWADHPFYESLTQQRIRTDSTLSAFYASWAWAAENRINGGKFNGRQSPSAGAGAKHLRHMAAASKNLHVPSSAAISTLADQTALTPAAITFKFLKKT